ncbi:hypothetical protein K474DRAFT_1409274 [Panus rudis PR-1116 ss-1]|nr:hypothetical protein K474DRAFT_1409274 [Panus rudis PR-1116 ss-1]
MQIYPYALNALLSLRHRSSSFCVGDTPDILSSPPILQLGRLATLLPLKQTICKCWTLVREVISDISMVTRTCQFVEFAVLFLSDDCTGQVGVNMVESNDMKSFSERSNESTLLHSSNSIHLPTVHPYFNILPSGFVPSRWKTNQSRFRKATRARNNQRLNLINRRSKIGPISSH